MKLLLPDKWSKFLGTQPETGMGFWTGNITLVDGRRFEDVIIDSGYIAKIRGRGDIPFDADQIKNIEITSKRWNWNE